MTGSVAGVETEHAPSGGRVGRARFLVGAVGLGAAALGTPWLGSAAAATEEDLAFANFFVAVELLLVDFHERALAANVLDARTTRALRLGGTAASRHAAALGDLLTGAGDTAPSPDDFVFDWPREAFRSPAAIGKTGRAILRPLQGAYQTAAASSSVPSYRVLFASLAASAGQQLGALGTVSGPVGAEPFPVAVDLETASDALQGYLG